MSSKFFSGKILDKNFELINGYLKVENGIIQEIKQEKPPKKPIMKGTVTPSFVNAHTHLADSKIQVNASNYSLAELVGPKGIKHSKLKEMSSKEKKEAMEEAIEYGFRRGVSSYCDFREGGIRGSKLLAKIREKKPVNVKIFGRPSNFNKNRIKKLTDHTDGIGISSVNDISDEDFEKLKNFLETNDVNLSIHVAESAKGQKKSLKEKNMTEIERSLKLDPNFLIHVTNPIDNDLRLIEKKDAPVVLCPRSNYKTGVGLPPLEKIINLNINVGLGTDNCMFNSTSILDELNFISKKYYNDTEKISDEKAKTLFKTATVNSGKIIGIDNKIKEGTKASFIVFEDVGKSFKSIINQKAKIKAVVEGENISKCMKKF